MRVETQNRIIYSNPITKPDIVFQDRICDDSKVEIWFDNRVKSFIQRIVWRIGNFTKIVDYKLEDGYEFIDEIRFIQDRWNWETNAPLWKLIKGETTIEYIFGENDEDVLKG